MRTLFGKLGLRQFLGRFGRERRGVSAVAFAITFAVLAPMSLGVFDIFTMTEQQGKLQDALDAAALYAARSDAFTTADVNTIGQKALTANLSLIPGAKLQSASFVLVDSAGDTRVQAQASVTLPAYAPTEFFHDPVTVTSEVTRPGNDLEVSLVLDTTGSMAGNRIKNLQSAANQLIDLVVSDQQTPYYSKLAIVPYSSSVNPGSYTDQVRGAVKAGKDCAGNPFGCPKYTFTNANNGTSTFNVSTCVSERIGSQAFTDTGPSITAGTRVGWVYPPTNENQCKNEMIQPLTTDRTKLHATIASLTALNSTAGHIGLAWGWYMVSPNWSSVWTGASAPAAYGKDHLLKVVILMTDGAFNTAYCNGVIAKDSGTGSGSTGNHANCKATNGDAFSQAASLCQNMKAPPDKVIVYTVGFDVGTDPSAVSLLTNCATDASHVYFPADDGKSLQVAFQAIAADLNRLRISK